MLKYILPAITLIAILIMLSSAQDNAEKGAVMNKFGQPKLTPEETRVIVDKGTERAFTSKFTKDLGKYSCRQCGAVLFSSADKFDSKCGWPSFDDNAKDAVKRVPDKDGKRTEVVCAKCSGHLGHVFLGEKFTDKNTRHCVNSVSLIFKPEKKSRAIFAGGCFWGVEYFFDKQPGVISATSGYTGGTVENPTYKQVCSGKTGHAEAVEVVYDPKKTSFIELARLYFETHDPTQLNRQGPDKGTQYRSEIFYIDDAQKLIADMLIAELKKNGFEVKTKVTKATKFYPAEDKHQDYYKRKKKLPYCHIKVERF